MREGFGEASAVVLGVAVVEVRALLCIECVGLLFDRMAAVIVMACADTDTGTAGDARDVEIWRSTKASSDREDNIVLVLVEQVLTQ
jgi:hypothetical protein